MVNIFLMFVSRSGRVIQKTRRQVREAVLCTDRAPHPTVNIITGITCFSTPRLSVTLSVLLLQHLVFAAASAVVFLANYSSTLSCLQANIVKLYSLALLLDEFPYAPRVAAAQKQ